MANEALLGWVKDALEEHDGRASLVAVARHIWENHEDDLRQMGNLFFTWQYDMRWAATMLRRRGDLRPAEETDRGVWELNSRRSSEG